MSIGIKVGNITDEIGTSDFFHSFFSTICFNLEESKWGKRFPVLLNNLYQGTLDSELALKAIGELNEIQKELSKLDPSKVIWDINELSKEPPWGPNISEEIHSLENYFVTSTGRDLIKVLLEALDEAATYNRKLTIVQC